MKRALGRSAPSAGVPAINSLSGRKGSVSDSSVCLPRLLRHLYCGEGAEGSFGGRWFCPGGLSFVY